MKLKSLLRAVGCHLSSLSPTFSVLLILSLPARSQKLSMDTLHQGPVGKQIRNAQLKNADN
jgi:hypothetical protein